MAVLKRKHITLICFWFSVCLIAILILGELLTPTVTESPAKTLSTHTKIIDKTKIIVTPFVYSDAIEFKLILETYENPDYLNIDILEHSIIKLSDTLYDNVIWEKDSKSTYQLIGFYKVPISKGTPLESIHLELFLESNISFNWDSLDPQNI